MLLSVVIPCYNEEQVLPLLWPELCGVLAGMHEGDGIEAEVVFVDDGSSDGTLSFLRGLCAKMRVYTTHGAFVAQGDDEGCLAGSDPRFKVASDGFYDDAKVFGSGRASVGSGAVSEDAAITISNADGPGETAAGQGESGGGEGWLPLVRYLSFSRNFGKEAALSCGLSAARGDLVAIMDADLQDPPSILPVMYAAVRSGKCDVAAARRVSRKGEPLMRSFWARCYYRLMGRISHTEMADGARDYRLMTRPVVDSVLALPEYNRFSKGIFAWVGYRTRWIDYENVERAAGETSWTFWGLARYSIEGITSFSTVPLVFAAVAGMFMSLVAFLVLIVIFIKTLAFGDPVSGWPSMACLVLFVGGVQLLCVGILGEYLAKAYMETKRRPLYVVAEEGGFNL